MKKRLINCIVIFIIILVLGLFIYPNLEFNIGNKIIKLSYSDDVSEFEDHSCYDESYFYEEKRDISIHDFEFKKFLFFHAVILEYTEGNICATEYVLEPSYINNFLENAKIESNDNNIDIKKLIEGKTPIVGNTRYFGNEYTDSIYYILDGEYQVLYVFFKDDLTIIQVGHSDEGPKFIAYK